jgi:hypothetical protein
MNKYRLLKLMAVALTIGPLTGCAVLNPNAPIAQRESQAKALAYAAASIGTQIELTRNPASSVPFAAAYDGLDSLIKSGGVITGAQLRDVLAKLPITKLQSPIAIIVIQDVTVLYDASLGTNVDLNKAPVLYAAAQGIRDGIGAALGKPPTP